MMESDAWFRVADSHRQELDINMQFDQFADNYQQVLDRTVAASGETSAYFAAYKARYLSRVLSQSFSRKALDFGCGLGLLSPSFNALLLGLRVHVLDGSPDTISIAD